MVRANQERGRHRRVAKQPFEEESKMVRTLWVAIGSALALLSPAQAQNWPSKPITMMVSFTAGSSIDVAGRIVAARMAEILGQAIVIENVGGAGGMVGASHVAKGASDGYQILFGNSATQTYSQSLYKAPLYNAATEFAPIALVAETPPVLIARNDLPVNNLKDFIAYAKTNQAKMYYGSAGGGSASHLACVLFNAAIGVLDDFAFECARFSQACTRAQIAAAESWQTVKGSTTASTGGERDTVF